MKKYKVGYTTGVFDLFHIGHLNILKRAKENCDYLIVGVSTDELVQSYKNKKPIIPFEDRKTIVEAIRYVDKVIPQENRDKVAALDKLSFDAMFVGDDWKGTPLFTEVENIFKSRGVDLIYLNHTEGISTTMLSEKVHNAKQ
jgi:glycerol-3-phosphate cytidylyltransferase